MTGCSCLPAGLPRTEHPAEERRWSLRPYNGLPAWFALQARCKAQGLPFAYKHLEDQIWGRDVLLVQDQNGVKDMQGPRQHPSGRELPASICPWDPTIGDHLA